jgi:hypothetical protein
MGRLGIPKAHGTSRADTSNLITWLALVACRLHAAYRQIASSHHYGYGYGYAQCFIFSRYHQELHTHQFCGCLKLQRRQGSPASKNYARLGVTVTNGVMLPYV